MPVVLSLKSVGSKFNTQFEIIENGEGMFSGIIDEIVMNQMPSGVFTPPNRLMRVAAELPLLSGAVIRSNAGTIYLVGDHGISETFEGTVFKAFRLFPTNEKFDVDRPVKITDPVTGLAKSESLETVANIWGIYQPQPEIFDRETHVSEETGRFITNYPVLRGDTINGKRVFRVDKELGLYIAILS